MDHSTDARPGAEEGSGAEESASDAGQLLVKISRLPHQTQALLAQYIDALFGQERLERLEKRVDALRQELASEVRTRRLVVVGPNGFERITADAGPDWGNITVASERGDDTYVTIQTSDESIDTTAAISLNVRGEVLGRFEAREMPMVGGEKKFDAQATLDILPFTGRELVAEPSGGIHLQA